MHDAEALLKKLINFKSVTPDDDGSLAWIQRLLEENGFECYLKAFGPDKVKNLYAIYKSAHQLAENICLAGHVDVVPPGGKWDYDPFTANQIGEKIYGRGAVDMKGALAAMLSAAIKITKKPNLNHHISFLLTADEEGEGEYGTKAMLKWLENNDHNLDFAFVGEPTSKIQIGDSIKIGRRGSLHFDLTIQGIQGHIAYPEKAINPNNIIVNILNDLTNLKIDNGNKYFQPSNLEISTIDTNNIAHNVIPATVNAHFNIRYNNERRPEDIVKQIEQIIQQYSQKYELKTSISAKPFLSKITQHTKTLIDAIKHHTGIEPEINTAGGTSDARFIQNHCPVVEFGLLSDQAHKINEYVKNKDLQKLHDVYYHALDVILNS